jgi:hypothetical protein
MCRQETAEILGKFDPTVARARRAYETYVAAHVSQGRQVERRA